MFFWIRCDGDPAQIDWSLLLDELDNLGEAGFNRDHLVLGDRNVLEAIASLDTLSRKARGYFQSASRRLSTIGSIRHHISCIYVSPTCVAPLQQGIEWTIPLSHFREAHANQRAHLLVEHLHDFEVTLALSQTAIDEMSLGGLVAISLRSSIGGGGGTHLTLTDHEADPLTIGICVVDSDRSHVSDRMGTTAATCKSVHTDGWKWQLHVLDARELENIVPPEFMELAAGVRPVNFADYYSEAYWPVYGYVDLKSSDQLCRYFEIPDNHLSYAPTRAALARLGAASYHPCCSCFRAQNCADLSTCQLNEPSPTVLRAMANWLRRPANRFPRRFAARVPALDRLVKEVVRLGAAPRFSFT